MFTASKMETNQWTFPIGCSEYPNLGFTAQNLEKSPTAEHAADSDYGKLLDIIPLKGDDSKSTQEHQLEQREFEDEEQNLDDGELFIDDVPSWKEMEQIRKAKRQGLKREKQKEHKCEICGRVYTRKEYLKNHWVVHTKEKPFVCPKCGMKFTKPSSVSRHVKTHHSNERKHVCNICNRAYPLKYRLTSHMKTHIGKPAVECPECGKVVLGSDNLARHLKVHKPRKKKIKKYKCGRCQEVFMSTDGLKIHVRENHMSEREQHFCEECGKSFPKAYLLNLHMKSHSSEKPYMCEICGNCFGLKGHLQRHLKTVHADSTPAEREVLEEHIDADDDMVLDCYGHFKSKPSVDNDFIMYACGKCGKCFIKEEHLRKHTEELNHTGELHRLEETAISD